MIKGIKFKLFVAFLLGMVAKDFLVKLSWIAIMCILMLLGAGK